MYCFNICSSFIDLVWEWEKQVKTFHSAKSKEKQRQRAIKMPIEKKKKTIGFVIFL